MTTTNYSSSLAVVGILLVLPVFVVDVLVVVNCYDETVVLALHFHY